MKEALGSDHPESRRYMLHASCSSGPPQVQVKGHECSGAPPPTRRTADPAASGGRRTGSRSGLTQKTGGEWADVSSSRCRLIFRKRSGFGMDVAGAAAA